MQEIILPFSPSVFNVIKYIGFSFILSPILEFLLQILIERKATVHVLRGRSVDPVDTRLGIFSLHSTFWGRSRNRLVLFTIGVYVIAVELLLEFSFSSKPVPLSTAATVWIPPLHKERYNFSNGSALALDHEPMQFVVDASNTECSLDGNFNLLPHHKSLEMRIAPNKTVLLFDKNLYLDLDRYGNEIAYFVEDNYTVRVPYQDALDETIIHCSADPVRANAKFFVPFVYQEFRGGEGVETGDRTSYYEGGCKMDYIRKDPEYSNVALANLKRQKDFYVGETPISVLRGNNTICCGLALLESLAFPDHTKHLCGLRGKSGFSLGVAQGELEGEGWEEREIPVVSAIIMHISGDAFKKLYDEDERQLRLLLILVLYGTEWRRFRLIRKGALEELARISLLVANEEGVSGLQQHKMEKKVYAGESEQASVKQLALIPVMLIVLFLLILMVYNIMLSRKIALSSGNSRKYRVDLTLQGLRNQLLRDIRELTGLNLGEQSVAYRLMPPSQSNQPVVRLLPLTLWRKVSPHIQADSSNEMGEIRAALPTGASLESRMSSFGYQHGRHDACRCCRTAQMHDPYV